MKSIRFGVQRVARAKLSAVRYKRNIFVDLFVSFVFIYRVSKFSLQFT